MPLEIHRLIINRLPDPVLLLNDAGDLLGFNQAARSLIETVPDLMEKLAFHVDAALAQKVSGPLRLNPGAPLMLAGRHYVPWLMPTQEEMALILLPDNAQQGMRHLPIGSPQDVAFSALLSAELRQELRRIAEKLNSFVTGSSDLRLELQHMQQILTTIDVMCNMLQQPQAVHGERLTLDELILKTLRRRGLPSSCLSYGGATRTRAAGARHFYGHAQWLLWTLDTLMTLMPLGDRPDSSRLKLHLRAGDSFIVLSGELGAADPHIASAEGSSAGVFSDDTTEGKRRDVLNANSRLTLAAQIIKLHGGDLRLKKDDSDAARPLLSFQLSIPLGRVPASVLTAAPGHWVPLSQAEALARDLARLLPRRSAVSIVMSSEERDMLASLCERTES